VIKSTVIHFHAVFECCFALSSVLLVLPSVIDHNAVALLSPTSVFRLSVKPVQSVIRTSSIYLSLFKAKFHYAS